jgi:hypothetical protein
MRPFQTLAIRGFGCPSYFLADELPDDSGNSDHLRTHPTVSARLIRMSTGVWGTYRFGLRVGP